MEDESAIVCILLITLFCWWWCSQYCHALCTLLCFVDCNSHCRSPHSDVLHIRQPAKHSRHGNLHGQLPPPDPDNYRLVRIHGTEAW